MKTDNTQELRQVDKTIIETEDPDNFIDLLNFDSFVAGQYNGNIPVQRHRLIFEKWLTAYTNKQIWAVLDRLEHDKRAIKKLISDTYKEEEVWPEQ